MILVIHPREHGETQDFCWLEPEPGDVAIGCCIGVGNTPEQAEADARRALRELAEKPLGTEVE